MGASSEGYAPPGSLARAAPLPPAEAQAKVDMLVTRTAMAAELAFRSALMARTLAWLRRARRLHPLATTRAAVHPSAMSELPGFFERLSLALRVLSDPLLAARVREVPEPTFAPGQLSSGTAVTQEVTTRVIEKVVEKERIVEKSNPEAGALLILSILQRDGRLIDFLHEDVTSFADSEVGAAARVVHAGCKKALAQYVTFAPVRSEAEGAPVIVEKGFDPAQIRLAGNVSGEPPFKGKLAHAGWKATDVRLPERQPSVDGRVVAPAEVDI